jgi:general secretion pathway protein G
MQTPSTRVKGSRRKRGFSLVEIVVVVAIIAMLSGGVAVAVVRYKASEDIKITRINAGSIRAGVKSWWIDNDSATCPTLQQLVTDGVLDRGKSEVDAWGQPWRIVCERYDATVISKGPDKQPDTEDDIRVPAT